MTGTAEIVLPAGDLDRTVTFFTDELGFRLESIFPADEPRVAVLSGQGVRLRLDADADAAGAAGVLRVADVGRIGTVTAPNGTVVELVESSRQEPELPAADPSLVVRRVAEGEWITGRAGMRYRDLVPGRQGGRFIASHIRIDEGGPVPDYVHFHRVRFQALHVVRGWVRVVYQDQGEPFVLEAGDGVLQPPTIRHRVLECSDGLEVVEVAAPALHETLVEHELELPNGRRPDARHGGQRFARYRAEGATWVRGDDGWERRDSGFADATGGELDLRIARPAAAGAAGDDGTERFLFVLRGPVVLDAAGERTELAAGDAAYLPPDAGARLEPTDGTELLEVRPRAT